MNKNYFDLIMERKSVRSFINTKLSHEKEHKIIDFAMQQKAPFGSDINFKAIAGATAEGRIGTYGFIKNPAFYLAGIVEKEQYHPADFGYIGEMALLNALRYGVSSCWLGGSFSKGDLAKSIFLKENETIPALIVMGEAAEKRHLLDKVNRIVSKSSTRKHPNDLFSTIHGEPLPLDGKSNLSLLIEAVLVAPSASNKQPWRMLIEEEWFHLFLRRDKGYTKFLKKQGLADLQMIDMGIAMSHLELVARLLNLNPSWKKKEPSGLFEQDWEYLISCKIH